ncbi:alkaline shock response membrane anchor protein AmaP [Paenibacillus arenilitoris]|uniref:Alkaline shock response membrane anchor protein AmaP n=1 Tax=Paenibacillus arenilitoris TaxID=2772299 RepID=A0A927CN03_9BACL|nr:alkaline shock response membrane anchor protein AmaP [Paenibacillus arenilitoris]MBD2869558.1 alkaline shock response membrane anchor protein AmaP [Paenibacillus arenilitoris]
MVKVADKLLLFLYSIIIGCLSVFLLIVGFGGISIGLMNDLIGDLYRLDSLQITTAVLGFVLFVLSLRFFIVSLQRGSASAPSIDQRTDFGDIRISLETIENLALKAASRQRGVKDLRARIRATDAGLDIVIRAVVDGESSIPVLTEEIQKAVKEHIEDIAGIPVTHVSVYVANIIQTGTFKSRVE